MSWWLNNNLRMIQNNLRSIDVQMDTKKYVETLKEFGANVTMIGCGGISSLYPTDLETQVRSPYLKDDFIYNIVEECHKNDIKVIVRFDFTKTDIELYEKHPEWFTVNTNGEPLLYNGTAAACVNGDYQQKHMFEVIKEVLERYQVDGIFFNAFMYNVWGYDGKLYGICQCESCKRRFKEMYGEELPTKMDNDDPAYQKYIEFQAYTLKELLDRVKELVKSYSSEIAICTYNDNVDIVRNESNHSVDRPLPLWIYPSSEHTSAVVDANNGRISSNVVINFVDFFARYMGISKHLVKTFLYQDMASGSGLDWCILGSFEDQPDKKAYESVKEVFQYHKKYEQYFGKFKSSAKILLVGNKLSHYICDAEYRGIYKMLKESHQIFNIARFDQLDSFADKLDEYEVILLPGIDSTGSKVFDKALKNTKACVIATGLTMKNEPENLKDIFGITLGEQLKAIRGCYVKTEPKAVFSSFNQTDWVYLDKEYHYIHLDEENEGLLPLISSASFGPPEKCFGHEMTDQASLSIKEKRFAYFPWMVGTLYYNHGYEEFKNLLLNVLNYMSPVHNAFTTNAPGCIEMFFNKIEDNQYLLQLINLSGNNGTTISEALPVYDIEVDFNEIIPAKITELAPEGEISIRTNQNKLIVDRILNYKAYLIKV